MVWQLHLVLFVGSDLCSLFQYHDEVNAKVAA
jgi:hypothetical protein